MRGRDREVKEVRQGVVRGGRDSAPQGPLTAGAVLSIACLFSAGLVLFYIFAAPYGDGLESTMDAAGADEGEPAFRAPLDYGGDYPSTLLLGLAGFAVVVALMMAVGRLLPDRGPRKGPGRG